MDSLVVTNINSASLEKRPRYHVSENIALAIIAELLTGYFKSLFLAFKPPILSSQKSVINCFITPL